MITWDSLSGGAKDVILQLKKVTWDGNISSKNGRDELITLGLAFRWNGYTGLSPEGMKFLYDLGKLEDLTR